MPHGELLQWGLCFDILPVIDILVRNKIYSYNFLVSWTAGWVNSENELLSLSPVMVTVGDMNELMSAFGMKADSITVSDRVVGNSLLIAGRI